MKIEITKQILQTETIDVELPYYYKHDLMSDYGDSVIYGKIDENSCVSIQETKNHDGKEKYEVEKENHHSIKNSGLSSYFDKKHASSAIEFEDVRQRFMSFLSSQK